MNKSVKGIAIAAAAMVTVGLLLAGIGFLAGGIQPISVGRDGIQVGGQGGEYSGNLENFDESLDSFSNIKVDLDFYDIDLIPSDKYAIEGTYDSEYGKPTFKVENDTLTVGDGNHKKFNIDISIFDWAFSSRGKTPVVKIYYPTDAKLKDVVIHCDASDLSFENLSAERAEFNLDFGELELTNVSAKIITVDMDSGDCILEGISADDLNVSNDFGETTLANSTLKTLLIDGNSGDVSVTDTTMDYGDLNLDFGELTTKAITSKGLKVEANSGDVELQGKLLGKTEVDCDMGEIIVKTEGAKDQYDFELNASLGSVYIEGEEVSANTSASGATAENTLKIKANMGDIRVTFN